MNKWQKLNQNQSGQAALEAAIILIAFVVVASVFAFAVLSAGTASTEKGQQAIYAGLEGVQSSMEIKGAVIALSPLSGDPAHRKRRRFHASVGGGWRTNQRRRR